MATVSGTTETVFCVMNDIQITHDYDEDAARNVVKCINNLQNMAWPTGVSCAGTMIGKPAAAVVNGDLTQNAGGMGFLNPGEQLDKVTAVIYNGLRCRMYAGLGNHDLSAEPQTSDKDQGRNQMWDYIRLLYKGYTLGLQSAKTSTIQYVDVPPAVPGASIDALLELRMIIPDGIPRSTDLPDPLAPGVIPPAWKRYSLNYSFDLGDIHFVQLHRYGGDTRWGHAGGLQWLARDLAAVGTERSVVICQHFGFESFSLGGDSDTQWTQAEVDTFISVIRPYNVIAMFHGHLHNTKAHYTYDLPADTTLAPIIEVKLVSGDSEKEAAAPPGFTRVHTDLNQGAGGKYIYLCYRRRSQPGEGKPITGLTAVSSSNSHPSVPPGYHLINRDANQGAGGKYVYICTSTQESVNGVAQPPILDIKVADDRDGPSPGYIRVEQDLNAGAGGSYIYLSYMVRPAMSLDVFDPGAVAGSEGVGGRLAIAKITSYGAGGSGPRGTVLDVVYGRATSDGTIDYGKVFTRRRERVAA